MSNPMSNEPTTIPKLLNSRQIIRHYVSVSLDTLNDWIELGRFPRHGTKIGRDRYWQRAIVEEWLHDSLARG